MASGLIFAGAASEADNPAAFPSRAVTAMVPWGVGSGSDITFRALAEVFPKHANGQPLVIVNKGEAAGVPGITDFMLNAKKDGYDVMHWNIAQLIKTHWDNVPYSSTTFEPICQVLSSTQYLYFSTSGKWKNVHEFIADAKANPGQITCGNAGTGGGHHLAAVLFGRATGIELKHVPYAGSGAAVTAVLTGEVQMATFSPPEGIAQALAGQAFLPAVFGEKGFRFADFPNAPTAIEEGIDFTYTQWRGVVAPKGLPAPILQRLKDIFRQCAQDPQYMDRMKSLSAVPEYADAQGFAALCASEDKRIGDVLREGKIGNRYK